MYRIFLVEDDETIARLIKKHLEKWEYEVSTVQDFGNVLGEFAVCDPQLVLLDIRLPFYNGHYWCTQIRHKGSDHLSVIRIGQYEHRDGNEYGRR